MKVKQQVAAILLTVGLLAGCGGTGSSALPTATVGEERQDSSVPLPPPPGSEGVAPSPADVPSLGDEAITTESGLEYEESSEGSGDEAASGQRVTVHYTGWLEDGTKFDSSVDRGQPFTFVLGTGSVIPGWDEGVAGMKVGGSRLLRIPADLGYGEAGTPGIPPNSTLIFQVELLATEPVPTPQALDAGDYEALDSGLRYAILDAGDGATVEDGNLVTFEYGGWFEDGTFFDSSQDRGQPAQLVVGNSGLAGLDEGLVGMQVGETRQLIIPPDLAFGAEGSGPIPPNTTLIFELTLVDTQEMAQAPDAPTAVEAYETTDSGLEYAILEAGSGDEAATGDTVTVHYSGWLEDGTRFDSSLERGQPFTFTLGTGGVIAGWDEGVVGMKVGETRQLRIPSELGYGPTGSGPIPPDATLLFEIELLNVTP